MIRNREAESLAQTFKNDWIEDKHKIRTTISMGVFAGGVISAAIHGLRENPAWFIDFIVAESPLLWNPEGRKATADMIKFFKEAGHHTINLLRPKIQT